MIVSGCLVCYLCCCWRIQCPLVYPPLRLSSHQCRWREHQRVGWHAAPMSAAASRTISRDSQMHLADKKSLVVH